jgi:hypothetical protein
VKLICLGRALARFLWGGEKLVVENLARWPETGFFREFFVTVEDIAKNPVSLILTCGEKPGFFRESRYTA